MPTQKHSPSRKTLALTLKYGRKHPEIARGKILLGRIDRTKRLEHITQVAKLLIQDENLFVLVKREWIDRPTKTSMSLEEAFDKASAAVADYAVQKMGSKELAINFLSKTKSSIMDARQDKVYDEILRISAMKRLNVDAKKDYVQNLAHPSDTALSLTPTNFWRIVFIKKKIIFTS